MRHPLDASRGIVVGLIVSSLLWVLLAIGFYQVVEWVRWTIAG